jgi:hypothetical protein
MDIVFTRVQLADFQRLSAVAAMVVIVTLVSACADVRIIGGVSVGYNEDGSRIIYHPHEGDTEELRIRRAAIRETVNQESCPASLYFELGSNTYIQASVTEATTSGVSMTPDQETAFREEKRQELIARWLVMGNSSGSAFLAAWSEDERHENEWINAKTIDCHLTLHPADTIYTRLQYVGPRSSNTVLECQCAEGPRGRCAHIVSPYDRDEMQRLDEPTTLGFYAANCGVTIMPENGDYIDELGAIAPRCDPVRNVEVRNCEIHGRIRAASFTDPLAKYSSPRADHVKRLRESAAQHLEFKNVTIRGQFRTPVHLLPGVHHVTVRDSVIEGGYAFSTVYLPADGGFNQLINNDIWGQSGTWLPDGSQPSGGRREMIAIDASEHNRIINNRFRRMPYGGIYLFRNCGERGMLRHRPAQYNQFINNVFDFGGRAPSDRTIHIGSRDDIPIQINSGPGGLGHKKYCYEDHAPDGSRYAGNDSRWPWDLNVFPNSSESNGDWAGQNVVSQNIFANFGTGRRTPESFVNLSNPALRLANNHVADNEVARTRAEAFRIQASRPAGCAVVHEALDGRYLLGAQPFINHGEQVDMFWSPNRPISLTCDQTLVCVDGVLREGRARSCRVRAMAGECSVEGDNAGCSRVMPCPAGTWLAGVQAACNLEGGLVSASEIGRVPVNQVNVVRVSHDPGDGHCKVNGLDINQGQARVPEPDGGFVRYGCSERDRDGGDCHARINMYCRSGSRP